MKKIVSFLTAIIITLVAICCSGCNSKLEENYYTPSLDFKGLNLECVSDGNTLNNVRNSMVYTDFPEWVKEDLNAKGNKITSIDISESSADQYNENQTVAIFVANIQSESGDIKSGEYYLTAYFAYNMSKTENVKMYLLNYCFVPTYEVDTTLFDASRDLVKDKTF
ncbi:MAG: hypothetical protein UH241_03145 [Acutalibacteraceae bacterium]|nr:hypothetical protein [Acutalibacteraceae bacterium]